MKARVLLADDHAIVRSGLRLLLERESDLAVAGEASDGREAVDWLARERADVEPRGGGPGAFLDEVVADRALLLTEQATQEPREHAGVALGADRIESQRAVDRVVRDGGDLVLRDRKVQAQRSLGRHHLPGGRAARQETLGGR